MFVVINRLGCQKILTLLILKFNSSKLHLKFEKNIILIRRNYQIKTKIYTMEKTAMELTNSQK